MEGSHTDGRRPNQLRPFSCTRKFRNPLDRGHGTARWAQDDTIVLYDVYAPKPGTRKGENPEKASIVVVWKPKTGQIGVYLPIPLIHSLATAADILFLCTGLRPVVLMDYGGTMPQLQENLCTLLHHARQETSILDPLRVMVIKDMLYLIHVKALAEHASPNARWQYQLAFVDLEKSYCKLLSNAEENGTVLELVSIQNLFSAKFPVDAAVDLHGIQHGTTYQKSKLPERTTDVECTGFHITDRTLLVVDLSAFLENAQIALPSLNGWLLGYPVTYLFCNGSAETATQNLSKHSLHIYRIYVVRGRQLDAKQSEEELMSFSVPCDMSTKRDEEPWAKSFIAHMNEKLKRCKHVWASMRLEVEFFRSQSQIIVL